ncbi:MAG: hypothetical protein JSV09_07925 [Thermoplasmata archaeon]|nr:MAG: hypothetical protein JSV09_07925 [Thermoplasmata archaeon]
MTEVFEAKLRKIGNSLGVIIPSGIIEELGYQKGDIVQIAIPPANGNNRNEQILKMAGIYKKKSPFKRDKGDRY